MMLMLLVFFFSVVCRFLCCVWLSRLVLFLFFWKLWLLSRCRMMFGCSFLVLVMLLLLCVVFMMLLGYGFVG